MNKKKTVGIYGGSFDPIHTGHAIVASYVAQWGGVDEVWLMVSPHNPLKRGRVPSDVEMRLDMARLVAERCTGVRVSDFELTMPVPSYTYDTLSALSEKYPDIRFCIIIGADNWDSFRYWRDYRKIIDEFGVIVYPRPGSSAPNREVEGVTFLQDAPVMKISSTFIREALAEGYNVNFMLPHEVADYVKTHSLYQKGEESGIK